MEQSIRMEEKGGVAVITLNRPGAFNAFGLDMIRILAEKLLRLAMDPKTSGLVITGEGRTFCAGGDLKWVKSCGEDYGAAFHALAAHYHQAVVEIRRMPKPVVAAINGLAAGGGFSMALACDFRVMEKSAVLRQAYTSNGLSIDGGGTYTLPRLVGSARAMEIAAFDRPIDSAKAGEWGLATEVVEDGRSLDRAVEMVTEISNGSLDSFGASKKLIGEAFESALEAQLEKERAMLSRCASGSDGKEGIEAFLEKRRPVFRGI